MTQLVEVVIPPLDQPYTYSLSSKSDEQIQVGYQVAVPLGRRTTNGYVVSKADQSDQAPSEYTLKEVVDSEENVPSFLPEQLEFFNWVAQYYGDSLSNVIDTAVPSRVSAKFDRWVKPGTAATTEPRGSLQKKIMEMVCGATSPVSYAELLKRFRGAGPALKRLEELQFVVIDSSEVFVHALETVHAPDWAKTDVELFPEQSVALQAITEGIESPAYQTYLLHGVTGSGKTEVYIEAIKTALERGLGALVVVPEIALTPQLVDRFIARLGSEISVLHSGLTKRERWDSWRALIEGRHRVAIGARSGVFAPVRNLGLIIVDEEHDQSYKQSDGLRYNGRDCAIVRGTFSKCPVVLGSATPSLESFHNAKTGKYRYLSIPARHTRAPMSIQVVDLNRKKPWDMISRNISPELHQALTEVIARKEQAFLLYNRRGFASYLQCDQCETVLECPNCSVTLTYHQGHHTLRCHYCNYQMVPPEFCPSCSQQSSREPAPELVHRGAGTERVYDELCEIFPDVVIDRLDRDSAHEHEQYRAILDRIRSGETSILVGTQMIAKGHDLPGVTLVGVVDCDVGLHMPDFRAGERVFQLLTQAGGRAGRSTQPGTVILQTRVPNHPSIQMTLAQDYIGFAENEQRGRIALGYPPAAKILRIVASATDQSLPPEILATFRAALDSLLKRPDITVQVLGPTPAPLQKLRTHWRWHMLLKAPSAGHLHVARNVLKRIRYNPKKIRVVFDMDPQDLL